MLELIADKCTELLIRRKIIVEIAIFIACSIVRSTWIVYTIAVTTIVVAVLMLMGRRRG
jgi:uncharacterized protein (DUF983 family)